VREPRRDRPEDRDVPPDGNADTDAADAVQQRGVRPRKRGQTPIRSKTTTGISRGVFSW
jgi:hypothetical protein